MFFIVMTIVCVPVAIGGLLVSAVAKEEGNRRTGMTFAMIFGIASIVSGIITIIQ